MERITRLVRVEKKKMRLWGVLEGEEIYRMLGSPSSAWRYGERLGSLETMSLLSPVRPTKIICVGRNYVAHAAEHNAEVPEEPLLFLKPPSSVIGPEEAIILPEQSERVEHEAELAIVINASCRNVTPEQAWDYILGLTCGNDVTARDLQRKDGQWTRGKGFDTFCPLGPWVVIGLDAAKIADLSVTCRVNSELRQQGRTSEMIFSPADLIAYASRIMTLEEGDVIMTGTPAGVGPLVKGDRVEVTIEEIGTLGNPVV